MSRVAVLVILLVAFASLYCWAAAKLARLASKACALDLRDDQIVGGDMHADSDSEREARHHVA